MIEPRFFPLIYIEQFFLQRRSRRAVCRAAAEVEVRKNRRE
ncbi:MAG: hypothetical protein ACREU6_18695 [Steroidobacteraceae bacterium]